MNREVVLASSLLRNAAYYGVKVFDLLAKVSTLTDLYALWQSGEVKNKTLDKSWSEELLSREQEIVSRHGISAVCITDDDYPAQLKNIPDAPYVLFFQGDMTVLHRTTVAMVGTRAMTSYGKQVINLILRESPKSLTTISGLALGVDAEIHRASLQYNLPTVGVLAAGLDLYEPKTNSWLAREIIKQGGLLLSEYPPEMRPQKSHFLARNRIVAGLSELTIIIEGKDRSGALVTGRLAIEYGRELGVIPGDITRETSVAPLRFLKDGAHPITNAQDIAVILKLTIQKEVDSLTTDPLLVFLRQCPATFDELSESLSISRSALQERLTMLELDSRISLDSSGRYVPF